MKTNVDKLHERNQEMLRDVISSEEVSSCCAAEVYSPSDEWAICMDCKEYCDKEKTE